MKKLFVVLIALCCCFSLIHAQSPVRTESQIVDAEVLNTVLQGINEMLETIETRLSVIEDKLGVETPEPTNSYTIYVGHTPENRLKNFTTEGLDEITFSDSDLPKVINRNLGVYDKTNSQNSDKEYLVFPEGLNVTAQYDFFGVKVDVFNNEDLKRTDLKEGYNVWIKPSFETNKPYVITISK